MRIDGADGNSGGAALSHHAAFLEPLGVSVGLLTGSVRAKERREIYEALSDGSMALVVGTHAIFQKEVTFARLALVITDEQHRFGVAQRTLLADKGGCPHKLGHGRQRRFHGHWH